MSEGVWRAAVIASNKRIEHTSRRATFKSFMTFFFTKEIAKLMQTRSISILYYTLIVCCQCTYTVQLPYGANFDLSTINKKNNFRNLFLSFFLLCFQIASASMQWNVGDMTNCEFMNAEYPDTGYSSHYFLSGSFLAVLWHNFGCKPT